MDQKIVNMKEQIISMKNEFTNLEQKIVGMTDTFINIEEKIANLQQKLHKFMLLTKICDVCEIHMDVEYRKLHCRKCKKTVVDETPNLYSTHPVPKNLSEIYISDTESDDSVISQRCTDV